MWWRFLTFCVLVSFVLIIVLNYLHDRPVVRLFFKRCCDDGIENDQVVFESFSNNYLKERLMAFDIVVDNGTFVPADVDIGEVIEDLRRKINVHDPSSRKNLEKLGEEFKHINDLRDDIIDDKENILEVDIINVLDISEIANTSDVLQRNVSDLSDNDKDSSDNETKDVVEIKTEQPDSNDTITVT